MPGLSAVQFLVTYSWSEVSYIKTFFMDSLSTWRHYEAHMLQYEWSFESLLDLLQLEIDYCCSHIVGIRRVVFLWVLFLWVLFLWVLFLCFCKTREDVIVGILVIYVGSQCDRIAPSVPCLPCLFTHWEANKWCQLWQYHTIKPSCIYIDLYVVWNVHTSSDN